MARPYACLIELLGLSCECPVFGCLRFRRQNSNGRVSSSVKLILDVPDSQVFLTEYAVWADFIYFLRFTKPSDFRRLEPGSDEITQREWNHLLHSLKEQKNPWMYRVPQAILEELRPEWLKRFEIKKSR